MKNTVFLVGIVALLIGVGTFVYSTSQPNLPDPVGAVVAPVGDGTAQQVVLSEKNYNYYPSTITVKAGQPVSLSLDSSVQGCLRSFTIRELKVAKFMRTPSDTVEFTVPKPGTYSFAC